MRSLLTLKALSHRETGGIVAAGTTSLPEKIGGSRNWDYRYCWLRDATFTLYALIGAGFVEEAKAWRRWLLRAAAGSPADLQIMYGVAGERRLDEHTISWLPGYENSAPVRVGNAAAGQSPQSVPVDSQSAQVDALAKQFPGGDKVPLIVVVSRTDGGVLSPSDIAAAQAAGNRVQAAQPGAISPPAPLIPSQDAQAALGVVPISANLSGLALGDAVAVLRTAAANGLPADLQVHVTGGPAFGADIASGTSTHSARGGEDAADRTDQGLRAHQARRTAKRKDRQCAPLPARVPRGVRGQARCRRVALTTTTS